MKRQVDCAYQVRLIQTFHIESRGWTDIGYNFLVGENGAIYVGIPMINLNKTKHVEE